MATKVVISFEVDNAGAVTKIQQVKKELGDVPQSTAKATSGFLSLKNALAAVATVFATVKIGQFLRESVQAAKEEQEVYTRLAATLSTLGVEYNSVSVELQGMFEKIQETTRFSDDEAVAVFQKLLVITRDRTIAEKLFQATFDAAIGTQRDAVSVAELLGRAVNGQVRGLRSLGIEVDEATQKQLAHADAAERAEIILGLLMRHFAGQAVADVKSFGGQTSQLANYWDDLKEAIGATLISMAQFGGKLMSLQDILKFWKDAILDFGQTMVTAFNVDYGAFFKRTLIQAHMIFVEWVAKINLAMEGLPDWLGGGDDAAARAYRALAKLQDLEKEFGDATVEAFGDAVKAGEEWRKTVENLISGTGALANVTGGDGGPGGPSLTEALGKLESAAYSALTKAKNDLLAYNEGVIDGILERWRERWPIEFPRIITDGFEGVPDALAPPTQEIADNMTEILGSAFSDMLGKGFMGELEDFGDLWDEIWQDLAKRMAGFIGDALEAVLSGDSGALRELTANLGSLGGTIAGLGIMGQAAQGGGGWGAILSGAVGGMMVGFNPALMWATGGLSPIIGAVIGGVIAALGSQAQEDPETFVRNLGLDTGVLQTRGHQGYSDELQALWIAQQQQIMRSYLSSYRAVLRLFGDQSLFELIGATPTFDTSGWMGMGADQLAQWLQQEFWPSAFMNMFQAAISEGLEGLGVTSGTLDQLWDELEDLPGEERMGALTTYVSSLVDLSHLVADMDWNAIMDVVGADSMTTFMTGVGEIAGTIETLMMALDDMTLIERAEQAQQIEQLIVQVRQAEIQYLQQLDSLQKGINASIASMLEQFQIGDMGPGAQQTYYQQRIAEIMALLAGGEISSPEQLQQLMADLQRYIQALAQGLGDQLFQPMDIMGWGQTWADYLSDILTQAQGYSDAYFEEFRDEIRAANDELIDAIRDLIDALTGATTPRIENINGANSMQVDENLKWGGGGQPQVNVYLEGSMSAIRPFVRAEIRDAVRSRPHGVS